MNQYKKNDNAYVKHYCLFLKNYKPQNTTDLATQLNCY